MHGKAKLAYEAVEAMLDAVFDWQDQVDALVTTGDDNDDIIATHDSRGRLLELWLRPGLQRELTTAELEDSINDAIADNAERARAHMHKISEEFFGRFRVLGQRFAHHPVGAELAQTYADAIGRNGIAGG